VFTAGAPARRRTQLPENNMVAIIESPIREGLPHPLGATWDGKGVNFALFSAHATRVELCLFDDIGARETARIELPEYTDEIWQATCRACSLERFTGTECTAPMSPPAVTASIRISYCSTRMRAAISAI
jgi:pullulanase/glycogen debranching enzyme